MDTNRKKSIRVILNPAAGQDEPALKIFNQVFRDAGYDWDVRITQRAGDARRLAKEAAREGVGIVAAYGGDGSVMEVASGLIGTGVPMGIIPGGTGNVFSMELGIPRDPEAACSLIVAQSPNLRCVDVGKAGDITFVERAGVGLEAAVTRAADREAKNKYGIFAYIISTIQALAEPDVVHYNINIDGLEIKSEGLTCIVANSGALGVGKLVLAPEVSVSDGMLDIFVIRKADLMSLFSLAASVLGGKNEQHDNMPHWKGKHIKIEAEPRQEVHADGELIGQSPIEVHLLEQAIQVFVPPAPEDSPETPAGADRQPETVNSAPT